MCGGCSSGWLTPRPHARGTDMSENPTTQATERNGSPGSREGVCSRSCGKYVTPTKGVCCFEKWRAFWPGSRTGCLGEVREGYLLPCGAGHTASPF